MGSAVVQLGFASEEDVLSILARRLCVPSISSPEIDLDRLDFSVLSAQQVIEYRALPYKTFRRTLVIGLVDPHNRLVIGELEKLTGRRIKPVVVLYSVMNEVLRDLASTVPGSESAPLNSSRGKGFHEAPALPPDTGPKGH